MIDIRTPGACRPISIEHVFPAMPISSGHNDSSSGYNDISSGYNETSSGHNEAASYGHNNGRADHRGAARDSDGCLLSSLINTPIVDDLQQISLGLLAELEKRAIDARNKQRLLPKRMEEIILSVCRERYLTLNVLAALLSRNPDTLRKSYLDGMVKTGRICRAFPMTPTHEKQAYKSVD